MGSTFLHSNSVVRVLSPEIARWLARFLPVFGIWLGFGIPDWCLKRDKCPPRWVLQCEFDDIVLTAVK